MQNVCKIFCSLIYCAYHVTRGIFCNILFLVYNGFCNILGILYNNFLQTVNHINSSCQLTNMKNNVYEYIIHWLTMVHPLPLYIDGQAGCGKTFLIYPIIGALHRENSNVFVSASSAFAAKNYPGGQTTHFLYGIPVCEDNPFLQSTICTNTPQMSPVIWQMSYH